jgi:hypothetical protein
LRAGHLPIVADLCVPGLTSLFYVIENKREWPVTPIKLNDKGDFMSRKKIIMIFDTWIVLWRLEGKRISLTADSRRLVKTVESSSSRFPRPEQLMA